MKEKSGTNIPRLNYRGYCLDPCPTASLRRGTNDPLMHRKLSINCGSCWDPCPTASRRRGNQRPSCIGNFQLTVDPAGIPARLRHAGGEPATLACIKYLSINCGSCWDRTSDPLIMSQML